MPSRLSWLLQVTAVATTTTTAGFFVWSKHAQFEPMDAATDPTFRSKFYARFNPNQNPTFHDVCVRRIPVTKLDPALVKDAEAGGDKLVTRFAQGREYLKWKYMNDTTTKHQLWTHNELSTSDYAVGTELTDHFNVLDRPDKNTILFRCGASPLDHPNEPRPGDGLFEMSAEAKVDQGFAEFRLKSVFYQGEGRTDTPPFAGETFMPWAHRQYAKLWMESAMARCRQRMTDIDWDVVKGKKSGAS